MLLLVVAMALDAVAALVLGVELESAVLAGLALEPSEAIEGAVS